MKKLVWLSDAPVSNTGYATISRNILNGLSDEWECHYLGHNYGGQSIEPLKGGNITFNDGFQFKFALHGAYREAYCKDVIQPKIQELQADAFGILLDTFMLYPWIAQMNFSPAKSFFYFPSDGGSQLPQGCELILRSMNKSVAMSKFAQRQVKELYNIDSEFIPHACDTDLFRPFDELEKAQARAELTVVTFHGSKLKGYLKDKFVVGCVSRNQGRKMLDRVIKAFSLFCKDKPNAILYLHTDPYDGAAVFDLRNLIQRYTLENRVVFSDMRFTANFEYKDMSKVYNVMDVFTLLTCIHPEMNVTVKEGIKKIKDIKKGDKVLTSAGEYRDVLNVIPSQHKGRMLTIKADGLPALKVTPNHKIYALRCDGPTDKKRAITEKRIELFPAGLLKKYDYVMYPIPKTSERIKEISGTDYIKEGRNQFGASFIHPNSHKLPSKIELDYEFGLLCGFYLSEGCSTKDGIALCFHTKEDYFYGKLDQILNNRFSLKTRITHNTRNRTTLWTTNSALGRMFGDSFGKKSHEKKLPEWILDSPKEFRRGLMEGLWKGDGCLWISRKSSKVFELQTVGSSLAHQTFNLLIAEGFRPTLSSTKRQSVVWKVKVTGNQNFGKFCNIKEELVQCDKTRIWSDGTNVYFPISKIEEEQYEGLVYDLTIDQEHNFCCHYLVKNSGEGFGVPIIEAMACGIPTVVTDYTTTPELLVENGVCGIPVPVVGVEEVNYSKALIERGYKQLEVDLMIGNGTITGSWCVERALADVRKGAQALDHLYHHPPLRNEYGRVGRQKALLYYSWSVVIPLWRDFLKRLTND